MRNARPSDWSEGTSEYLHGEPIAGVDMTFIHKLRSVGRPEAGRRYPRAQLIGNYGIGCVDTQRLDYHGLTRNRLESMPGLHSACASMSSPISMRTISL
jgi:hypothetical protein